jgi:ABC-type iron transport system FetAB ATPase subunit
MQSPRTPRENHIPPELIIKNLTRSIGDKVLWSNISFSVRRGETIFIRGPSGVGKTLLLRSLACLDPLQSGSITFEGQTPDQITIPKWRALITYVFQQRIASRGTPSELYYTAQRFSAQRGRPRGDLPAIIHELGLEQAVLNQPWSELSGGQAQRVQIAIAVALCPSVLLLDEPTSSLDVDSARKVERLLKNCGAALIWVSHDPHQPARVGGRVLELPGGIESIAVTPPASPALAQPSSLPKLNKKPSEGGFKTPGSRISRQLDSVDNEA